MGGGKAARGLHDAMQNSNCASSEKMALNIG
jgi:hypothetical protein